MSRRRRSPEWIAEGQKPVAGGETVEEVRRQLSESCGRVTGCQWDSVGDHRGGESIAVLVYIYGPPACGKLTVAKQMAERSEFRVFHNHLTVEAVLPIFDRHSEAFREALTRMRMALITEAIARRVDLVFTNNNAWLGSSGRADFERFAERLRRAVRACGGETLFVQLTASPEVLRERVVNETRRPYGKLGDPERLNEYLAALDPAPLHPDDVVIETDRVSPGDAALQILARAEDLATSRRQPPLRAEVARSPAADGVADAIDMVILSAQRLGVDAGDGSANVAALVSNARRLADLVSGLGPAEISGAAAKAPG